MIKPHPYSELEFCQKKYYSEEVGVVENKRRMLKVECDRWNQSSSILRQEALKANYPRKERTFDGTV
ncbi:MAG: hypothetical protein V7K21_11450 [Nostoc sp.]|uniref:hypothetical protein n=1 Tax=Nostoc sp. TaxID=1180 RepID=UPI002FFC1B20